jgi:hypothetical protein
VHERCKAPRDDVISALLAARVEGRALTDEEIFSHVRLLFPTGGETDPRLPRQCAFDPAAGPGRPAGPVRRAQPDRTNSRRGCFRFETPIAVLPHMSASHDIEFHGVEIPADSWVLFAIAGTNRDPACFDVPDRFEIGRDTSYALTSRRGVKSCPGTHLARRNLCVSIGVLLERMPRLELVDREAALPDAPISPTIGAFEGPRSD